MERFRNIIVVTDTRNENQKIVAEAVEIAQLSKASLKIVDVVPDFPWTVRMTLKNHEHLQELTCQEKAEQLEQLVDSLDTSNIEVKTAVLRGQTSLALIREVLRDGHDLLMRVVKGTHSRSRGFFGTTGMRLLRKCPCPVWLVTPQAEFKFDHVLGCVDTSTTETVEHDLNTEVFQLAHSVSKFHEGRLSLIHAWSIWNELMLKNRMSDEEFEQVESRNRAEVAKLLEEFLERQSDPVPRESVHLVRGEPSQVIPQFAAKHNVDLIVMGTVGRSGLSGMIMGNTAERILSQIQCSVLAVKPADFKTPVEL